MWTEKLAEMHKNPMNCLFHVAVAIVVAYGLWTHVIEIILGGILVAVFGHILKGIKKKKRATKKNRKTNKSKRKKKAALEMSIGTIVIMVIAVTMLILGIVLVRSIMCAGMQMTDEISKGMRAEIIKLFGSDSYGVRCMGEGGGSEVKLGSGGRRAIACIIKVDENVEYELDVKKIESLKGASTSTIEKWVINEGWTGRVSPGGDGKDVVVVLLDIPRDAPTTTLDIEVESENKASGVKDTHNLIIDIQPANFFTNTMC